MNQGIVQTEQDFNVAPEILWSAITDPVKMKEWFFSNIPAFRAEKGFSVSFDVKANDKIFEHQWKIIRVVPGRLIRYQWKYGDYPGNSQVTFEIFGEYPSSKLTLTHEGIDSFPRGIPEFSRESCKQGWDYFIRDRLKKYLDDK